MSKIVGVTVGTPLSLNRIKREIEPVIEEHEKNKENPHGVTKTQVGLGNVDNTADMDKPVSTAQAAAIKTAKTEAIDAARFAQTCVNDHMADRTNPHGVTAAQIGAMTEAQVRSIVAEELGVIENGTY